MAYAESGIRKFLELARSGKKVTQFEQGRPLHDVVDGKVTIYRSEPELLVELGQFPWHVEGFQVTVPSAGRFSCRTRPERLLATYLLVLLDHRYPFSSARDMSRIG